MPSGGRLWLRYLDGTSEVNRMAIGRLQLAFVRALVAPHVLASCAVIVSTAAAAAQEPEEGSGITQMAERCRAPEYRQFDFWVGQWEVRNIDGALLGHSDVQRVSRGCGLLERWNGAAGGSGVSVNTYDAALGAWTQRWVGEGAVLWLQGGLEDDRMVLHGIGPRSTPRGMVLDRISWAPMPDGRLRQTWEVSADGGVTWQKSFEGLYARALAPPREE
jgi:hypothetical protein